MVLDRTHWSRAHWYWRSLIIEFSECRIIFLKAMNSHQLLLKLLFNLWYRQFESLRAFPLMGFGVLDPLLLSGEEHHVLQKYVRFNTMHAIVLDVLLIFSDLLERSFNPKGGLGLNLLMSLDNTIFLFLLVCLVYESFSYLLGQVPILSIVVEVADI